MFGAILAAAGLAVAVVSVLFVQQTGDWPPKVVLPDWLTYVGLGVMFGGIAWAAYGYMNARPKKVKAAPTPEQKPAPAPSTGNPYWDKEGSLPCPACGEPVKPGYARCPKCTVVVTRECPSCKEKLPADFKACPKCGEIFDQ